MRDQDKASTSIKVTGAAKLKLSVGGYLMGLLALGLAMPAMFLLVMHGLPPDFLGRETSGTFQKMVAHQTQIDSSLFLSLFKWWIGGIVLFCIPALAMGLVQRHILWRIGRNGYRSCALICAVTAPLSFLLFGIVMILYAHIAMSFLGFILALVIAEVILLIWLAPFGAAQGLIYRALAGVEHGSLFEDGTPDLKSYGREAKASSR